MFIYIIRLGYIFGPRLIHHLHMLLAGSTLKCNFQMQHINIVVFNALTSFGTELIVNLGAAMIDLFKESVKTDEQELKDKLHD